MQSSAGPASRRAQSRVTACPRAASALPSDSARTNVPLSHARPWVNKDARGD
ncbi:MAG: hypothetical protein R3A10_02185 [Caldilineaceae bacterium]